MVTGTVFKTLVLSRFLFLFFFHFFFVGFVTSNLGTHNINPCCRGGNFETNIKCFFISCDVNVINLATQKKKMLMLSNERSLLFECNGIWKLFDLIKRLLFIWFKDHCFVMLICLVTYLHSYILLSFDFFFFFCKIMKIYNVETHIKCFKIC